MGNLSLGVGSAKPTPSGKRLRASPRPRWPHSLGYPRSTALAERQPSHLHHLPGSVRGQGEVLFGLERVLDEGHDHFQLTESTLLLYGHRDWLPFRGNHHHQTLVRVDVAGIARHQHLLGWDTVRISGLEVGGRLPLLLQDHGALKDVKALRPRVVVLCPDHPWPYVSSPHPQFVPLYPG